MVRRFVVLASLALLAAVALQGRLTNGADGGVHSRTAAKLLSAFKDLRESNQENAETAETSVATFGTGCFWCTEAIFEQLEGVKQVLSGYSGGHLPNPTYQQVLTKTTGHAEVIHLAYDPSVISYTKLLEAFWFSHDPTTLNRQGPDFGPQYRSVVFYHDDTQRELAEQYKRKLNESNAFSSPIVTEISKFSNFYPAENYHQDYFALNGRQPYCRQLIRPKVQKFRKVFQEDLKKPER